MPVPTTFVSLAWMLMLHGFFLDIIIIGVLPFLSASAGDKSRKALFPWCLGGYGGFGSSEVPNLAPCHRRFIAENAAYAVLRGVPGIYILTTGVSMQVLTRPAHAHACMHARRSAGSLHCTAALA